MKMAKIGWGAGERLALVLAASALVFSAGNAVAANRDSSVDSARSSSSSRVQVVREIDDPTTGTRWLLLRDLRHPGRPGRLVREAGPEDAKAETGRAGTGKEAGIATQSFVASNRPASLTRLDVALLRPVVRAGDDLIVEEHTDILDLQLEATALAPAAVGSALNVRLKVGGKIVRTVVLGPGRAALEPAREAWP